MCQRRELIVGESCASRARNALWSYITLVTLLASGTYRGSSDDWHIGRFNNNDRLRCLCYCDLEIRLYVDGDAKFNRINDSRNDRWNYDWRSDDSLVQRFDNYADVA